MVIAARRGTMERPMTDDNPSPTTRTPIPEPHDADAPTEGWPVVLIGVGLWVVLGSLRRGTR